MKDWPTNAAQMKDYPTKKKYDKSHPCASVISWMVPVPETLLNRLNGWRLSELPKQFQFKGDRMVLGCVQKATQICSLDAIQQPNVIYLCCVGHFGFYSNWIIQHNRRIVNEKHNYSGRMEIESDCVLATFESRHKRNKSCQRRDVATPGATREWRNNNNNRPTTKKRALLVSIQWK